MGAVSPELESKARQVLEMFVDRGMYLKDACAEVGLSLSAFHRAVSTVSELAVDLGRAREILSVVEIDEIKEIADRENLDPQKARNMIDARKFRAARHHRKLYGDSVEITGSVTSINIMSTIEDARSRLRPMSDLAHVQDAELVELPTLDTTAPSDTQSDEMPGLLS